MAVTNTPPDLLRGTVDLLILRTVARASLHGYAIAQRLRVVSGDVPHVGESALYPSLPGLADGDPLAGPEGPPLRRRVYNGPAL